MASSGRDSVCFDFRGVVDKKQTLKTSSDCLKDVTMLSF
jgi:hypothetical protein